MDFNFESFNKLSLGLGKRRSLFMSVIDQKSQIRDEHGKYPYKTQNLKDLLVKVNRKFL